MTYLPKNLGEDIEHSGANHHAIRTFNHLKGKVTIHKIVINNEQAAGHNTAGINHGSLSKGAGLFLSSPAIGAVVTSVGAVTGTVGAIHFAISSVRKLTQNRS